MKVKVRLRAHHHIYIHNDIGNAAFYFKERVNQRAARDDREGIAHEIIAALTLLAFEIEARFNFLGYKLIEDWDEWQAAKKKIEAICNYLGVKPDFSARPYLNVEKLRAFRNTLAHGKPEEVELDEEVVATAEELDERGFLHAEWEAYIEQDFLNEAYDDAEQVWKELLEKSGLTVFETMTSGTRSFSFIEHVKGSG
jgi:hypothetical protein